MENKPTNKYVLLRTRVIASIIDGLYVGASVGFAQVVIALLLSILDNNEIYVLKYFSSSIFSYLDIILILLYVAITLFPSFYIISALGSKHQAIYGMRIMNYRIQRVSGSDVSYWMSFIRFFIHALLLAFISFFLSPALSLIITPLLFLIFGLCSKMKQLPHDMETKTVMVYAKSTLSTKIKNRILTYILIAVILVILFAAYTAIAELA